MSTTNDSIVCKGSLTEGKLRGTYIPTSADIVEGNDVQTSGMGGIYPKGIIIGKITEVVSTLNPLDRYAWIEPAVDFNKVETVLVIKK